MYRRNWLPLGLAVPCLGLGAARAQTDEKRPEERSAARPLAETDAVKALIDRAESALKSNGSDISAILSDPAFLPVHGWPRFRQLARTHARSSLTIVTPQERGKRLRVRMRLVEAGGSASIGALVYFYHTDDRGDYGPNDAGVPLAGSDNNYARLFGYAVTDADGTIEIQTIRPGGYPNDSAPEHIHVRITTHDGRSFGAEVWFDDDPRVNREAREEAAQDRIVICPPSVDSTGRESIDATIKLD